MPASTQIRLPASYRASYGRVVSVPVSARGPPEFGIHILSMPEPTHRPPASSVRMRLSFLRHCLRLPARLFRRLPLRLSVLLLLLVVGFSFSSMSSNGCGRVSAVGGPRSMLIWRSSLRLFAVLVVAIAAAAGPSCSTPTSVSASDSSSEVSASHSASHLPHHSGSPPSRGRLRLHSISIGVSVNSWLVCRKLSEHLNSLPIVFGVAMHPGIRCGVPHHLHCTSLVFLNLSTCCSHFPRAYLAFPLTTSVPSSSTVRLFT